MGGRDVGPAIVDRGGSEATSRCGDGGSRAGSDAEMQVAEVEVEAKVGGSGTFGWHKGKRRKKGYGMKKNGRGGAR